MSNPEWSSADVATIARAVRDRISASLVEQEKPVTWLAETAGIPNVTLNRHLQDPSGFKLPQLIAIAFALDIDFGWLNTGRSE